MRVCAASRVTAPQPELEARVLSACAGVGLVDDETVVAVVDVGFVGVAAEGGADAGATGR